MTSGSPFGRRTVGDHGKSLPESRPAAAQQADVPAREVPAEPPARSPSSGVRMAVLIRIAFYLVLTLVGLAALNETVLTLAFLSFIIPGYLMLGAAWAMVYLPILDWPVTAWLLTRSYAKTLFWLTLSLTPGVLAPMAFNATVQALIAGRANDDIRPAGPLPLTGTVLLMGVNEDPVMTILFAKGAVDHLLTGIDFDPTTGALQSGALYTATRSDVGPRGFFRPLDGRPGWSLTGQLVGTPRYDIALRYDTDEPPEDRPHALVVTRQLTVWTCPDVCRLASRQTQSTWRRLAWPLRFRQDFSGGEMAIHFVPAMEDAHMGGGGLFDLLGRALAVGGATGEVRTGFSGDVSGGMPGIAAALATAEARHQSEIDDYRRRDAELQAYQRASRAAYKADCLAASPERLKVLGPGCAEYVKSPPPP